MSIDTDSKVAMIVEAAQREAADTIAWNMREAFERCDSPIERLFVAAMLHPSTAREYDTHVEQLYPASGLIEHCEAPPIPGVWMWQQAKIGQYRADFLLDYTPGRGLPRLIVECDGHDFHERTKEQAQRDKARDRFLVGRGFRIVRFTGAELYRDPFAAAHQSLQILMGIAD